MARGAVKQRPKQPKEVASPRRQKQPKSWEEELFFSRLRNHAKWMFVFLALVFGVGFVAFGVGTGSNGLSDVLQDNFLFSSGSASGDVDKARDRVKDRPNDPAAYLALSRALQAADKRDEAIAPMERYTRLRPKNSDALRELASLYLVQGQTFQDQGQIAQAEVLESYAPPFFLPPQTTKLGQALAPDPIYQSVSSLANEEITTAVTGMQAAFGKAVATYKRLAALNPDESSAQFELAQTAEQAGDIPTAITAYKRFLVLAPQDPTAPAVRDRIKQLQASQAQGAPAPTG
ncbi:MAG: tetratricopeptide repeat protein [Actinomycetota bacterium]|nr:tetratricopeptide repeat protein [Actinomycetota bacterium]